ncbi:MAG TPA: hypothetical protein VLH16_01390, partial [Bacteroidales bacterium]|nr:hypothetical protein [Bacteroidales bacterium]
SQDIVRNNKKSLREPSDSKREVGMDMKALHERLNILDLVCNSITNALPRLAWVATTIEIIVWSNKLSGGGHYSAMVGYFLLPVANKVP